MTNKLHDIKELEELRSRLEDRRLYLKLTYQQLADKTGISKSTLQRYEKGGIKKLPYDKIAILSEALEVPIAYFSDLSMDRTVILNDHKNDMNQKSNSNSKIESLEARNKYFNQGNQFHELAITRIAAQLAREGYGFTFNQHNTFGDIVAIRGKESWYIEIKYVHDLGHSDKHHAIIPTFINQMGQLATSKERVTKYSILYNIDGIGDHLPKTFSTKYLNVDVSLLYLTNNGYREVPFTKE